MRARPRGQRKCAAYSLARYDEAKRLLRRAYAGNALQEGRTHDGQVAASVGKDERSSAQRAERAQVELHSTIELCLRERRRVGLVLRSGMLNGISQQARVPTMIIAASRSSGLSSEEGVLVVSA